MSSPTRSQVRAVLVHFLDGDAHVLWDIEQHMTMSRPLFEKCIIELESMEIIDSYRGFWRLNSEYRG